MSSIHKNLKLGFSKEWIVPMRKLHRFGPCDLSTNRREFLRQVAGMGVLTATRGLSLRLLRGSL